VCIPARCSLLYGLNPQRTGVYTNGRMMDDNGASYPALLGQAGYRTAAIGKCHFTPDPYARRGFEERIVQEERTENDEADDYRAYLAAKGLEPREPHGERGPMYYLPQPSRLAPEDHPTQWIGDRTIEWIDQRKDEEAPWCVFSSFIHPHPPLTPPRPWTKLYLPSEMPLPLDPDHAETLLTHINRTQNRYKWRDRGTDLNLLRAIKAYYYACVSFIDFQVGRILDHLEQAGILDNTLVVFSSDHGEYLGDYGCFGKRAMHDASARGCRSSSVIRAHSRPEPSARPPPVSSTSCPPFSRRRARKRRTAMASICSPSSAATPTAPRSSRNGATGPMPSTSWRRRISNTSTRPATSRSGCSIASGTPIETRNAADLPHSRATCEAMRAELLRSLREAGATEAYVEHAGELSWRRYPRLNQRYLEQNPDAGLLYQDEPINPGPELERLSFRRRGSRSGRDGRLRTPHVLRRTLRSSSPHR
jgi:hypothetical protein